MKLRLGGEEIAWHGLWVELNYVGLEVLGVKTEKKAEEGGGEEEVNFGLHWSSVREKLCLLLGCISPVTDSGVFEGAGKNSNVG